MRSRRKGDAVSTKPPAVVIATLNVFNSGPTARILHMQRYGGRFGIWWDCYVGTHIYHCIHLVIMSSEDLRAVYAFLLKNTRFGRNGYIYVRLFLVAHESGNRVYYPQSLFLRLITPFDISLSHRLDTRGEESLYCGGNSPTELIASIVIGAREVIA